MIKGILFDKDGTLVEFSQFWHTVFLNFFRILEEEYQVSKKTIDEIKMLSGFQEDRFERESMIQYLATSDIMELWHQIIKKNEASKDIFYEEKKLTEILEEQLVSQNIEVKALDGVVELLNYLKAKGYFLGVATADTKRSTIHSLKKSGIYDYFDYVGCDEAGVAPKPSSQMALHFCNQVNIATNEILIVGDSVTDMQFAENAGADFVGIRTAYNRYQEFEQKNKKMVESMKDIIAICDL